jgi:hypothetical protein
MIMQRSENRIAVAALAIVLWLVTVAVALFDLYALRQIFVTLFFRFGGSLESAQNTAQWLVLALALAWIAFVIGTGEYHREHFGRPESWRLFGWSLAAEIGIAALYYAL